MSDDISLDSVRVDSLDGDSDSEFDYLPDSPGISYEKKKNKLHTFLDDLLSVQSQLNPENIDLLRKMLLVSPSSEIDDFDSNGKYLLHKLLDYLLENNYKDMETVDVVELILNKSNLDYRYYEDELILILLKKYDKKIPKTIKFIQWQILNQEGENLIETWQMSQEKHGETGNDVSKDVKRFVCAIRRAIKNEHDLDDIIGATFASGSQELLKYILYLVETTNVKFITPIIINAIGWGIFTKQSQMQNFQKCWEYLLESVDKTEFYLRHGYAYIQEMTALHVADAFNVDFMAKSLLAKHAPITAQNGEGKFPIQNASYDTLQDFFDSLITFTPTRFLEEDNVWKLINSIYKLEYKLDGFIFMDYDAFLCPMVDNGGKVKEITCNDLEFMEEISRSSRLSRLIDHPVLAVLLELHWTRFKKWILLDQISIIFMILTSIVFIMESYTNFDFPKIVMHYVIGPLSVAFLLLELIKSYKLFQIIMRFCGNVTRMYKNQKSLGSYPTYQTITSICLKIPVLILILLYAIQNNERNENHNNIVGCAIIFMSINITLLIAYYNQNVAHSVIMFLYVAYTGLRFICSMILILFGFGIGLFLLINVKQDQTALEENPNNNATIWNVLIQRLSKAFIMSTGEIESSYFDLQTIASHLVFIFFIFVIPIVFFNLLNGLAIEDIQKIKKEAMFWYRHTQVRVLFESQELLWRKSKSIPYIPRIDISLYPHILGEQAFIGICTITGEIFAMNGLTWGERKLIGYLSKNALNNAIEILSQNAKKEEKCENHSQLT